MTNAPRVLFLTHNAPRHHGDAAGSFVLRLAAALQQAGAVVDVVAPGASGLAVHDQIDGVAITRVRYASDARMTLAYEGTMVESVRRSWSGRLALVQLLWQMRRAVRRAIDAARAEGRPYLVVHAHWWFPAALALWKGLGRRTDPPLVITMHGSDVRLAEAIKASHPVMRAVLNDAASLTTVSLWLASTVRRIVPGQDVTVAPMPIAFDADAEEHPASPREGILFVGRLNAQKGVADLLRALAEPALHTAVLTIIGDGPDRDRLESTAQTLGVADRIRWLGHRPHQELTAHYRAARVVAMPSRGEGLGLVAVEAQCAGTPVVAYADAGLLDVVDPAFGNALVPPGDASALAMALAKLLDTPLPSVAIAMREARVALRQRFAPESVAQRYLAIYRSAVASDAASSRKASA